MRDGQQNRIQVIRDAHGLIIGRLEHQALTGRVVARSAAGVLVGSFDIRTGTTRDKAGRLVGRGNMLAALIEAC